VLKDLLDRKLSIRQLLYIAITIGVPYVVIGVIWALNHQDHLTHVHGIDKLFSVLGEVIAWPPLIISNITLT